MKLYEDKPNYVRLDDDVSFQIVRTNPKLTTNTKLMYDGENLYMESYDAAPLLSTLKYKHHQVWKTSLFNRDIRNFLLGTNTTATTVGQTVDDTIVLDDFDNQFENMYWCGVESINSDFYPQEMGCVAPLYLRKKRPNYFVIFKIDTPANTNTKTDDYHYKFYEDVMNRAKIIKTFDLRENTPLGQYIKRYVEQRNFKYDQSIYMNFSSHEIYYYGIDRYTGVLTQKVENFEDHLLKNDNTILKSDEWITSGFERNNLIFPYILNIEFLFDDKETEEFKFARYFGMYCNDIDLYTLNIRTVATDTVDNLTGIVTWNNNNEDTIDSFNKFSEYYIKDKYKNLYSVSAMEELPGQYNIKGIVDKDALTGFEPSSVSTHIQRVEGCGYAYTILDIVLPLSNGDSICLCRPDDDPLTNDTLGVFTAVLDNRPGSYYNNGTFSCGGTLEDTATALAGAISISENPELMRVTAYSIGTKVVIKALTPGTILNDLFEVVGDPLLLKPHKIEQLTDSFCGGTDVDGCLFKVYTSDKDMYFDTENQDPDPNRYLKTRVLKENAKILHILPYINEDGKIDDTYSLLVTDDNGPYVTITNTELAEINDKYYPRLGVLSFFPVRDFDFDSISSVYGDYTMIEKEFKELQEKYDQEEEEEEEEVVNTLSTTSDEGEGTTTLMSSPNSQSPTQDASVIDTVTNVDGPISESTGISDDEINNHEMVDEGADSGNGDDTPGNPDDGDVEEGEIPTPGDETDPGDETTPDDETGPDVHLKVVDIYNIMPFKRFYDDNGNEISTEYDYFCENIIPDLVTESKTTPYIVKWGYIDESKDSCENPYRLNASKIFETCNFSANTYLQKGDITEFTHSMPYYVSSRNIDETDGCTNEYQYIPISGAWGSTITDIENYFSNTEEDRFEKVFWNIYHNKRYNKKYSRFLTGDTVVKSSTLFRGVKFEITELDGGKEVKTGKYNGYRFSFVYVPKTYGENEKKDNKIHFIKNDVFKFIIGVIYFDTKTSTEEFNKAYVYAGSMGFLKKDDNE